MWRHDGQRHRLDQDGYTIDVTEMAPPAFDSPVDVEVIRANSRWSATFLTPEQARDLLARWHETGESLPGDHLDIPDAVIVTQLTLDSVAAVVRDLAEEDGHFRRPLMPMLGG